MLVAILDNLRSAENVGSILRTAEAADFKRVILAGITPGPGHPKVLKASLGAEKYLTIERAKNSWRAVEKLKKEGFYIVALEITKEAKPYWKIPEKQKIALVVGNEVKGISKSILKRSDIVAYIPMSGRKESLNVAVAFGVVAFYLQRRHI